MNKVINLSLVSVAVFVASLALSPKLWASTELKNLPSPVKAIELSFSPSDHEQVDHEIKYEDCVESVMFRLIHAFGRIHPEKIQGSSEFQKFAKPNAVDWSKDPLNDKKGAYFRKKWANWLSSRPGFVYATAGKYGNSNTHELKATWPNIRTFFLTLWPKIPGLSSESGQDKIADICKYFGKEWECKVLSNETSSPFEINGEIVEKNVLSIGVSYKGASYLKWEVEQLFRVSDHSRVTGDSRLIDLRG